MAMLHIVNKSAFGNATLNSCIKTATQGSSILLIEDAVYAAMGNTSMADIVKEAMNKASISVLGPDLAARGMDQSKVIEGISVIGYDGFVDIVAETDNVQSWL